MIEDMADFKNEMKLMTIFRAASTESPKTFVKVCAELGVDPNAAAATFDPSMINDDNARAHVIQLQEYLAKRR